jgi:hypothetical protein
MDDNYLLNCILRQGGDGHDPLQPSDQKAETNTEGSSVAYILVQTEEDPLTREGCAHVGDMLEDQVNYHTL